jgi:D-aspartate ligase
VSAREPRQGPGQASAADDAPAIVLACGGAAEGPLGAVRSLGPHNVTTFVITENATAPVTASRYCKRVVVVPGFIKAPERLLAAVSELARLGGSRPILLPTADPDLLALARLGESVRALCHVVAPPPTLTMDLTDKRRFAELARRLKIAVPATVAPESKADVATAGRTLRFPVVVKPSHPTAWHPEPLGTIVGSAKAIRIDSREELERVALAIAEHSLDFLIQELIPGRDEEHVDLHAYFDAGAEPRAWFTGRKLRICPPHAGSGCYVRSEVVEPVVSQGLEALRRAGFVGIANVNFKRDCRTGEYLMLEINPRVSQWNILAARAGVNLPLWAWRDMQGLPLPPPPRQTDGISYVNLRNDRAAFAVYRREGLWTRSSYLRSLMRRPLVHQFLDLRDPGPALRLARQIATARLRRLLRGR